MNTTERFSGRAGVYQASRPGYPAALSEHLASLGMRGARVADIGAGTGIFSRLLLELGCTVFAVEPNSDMRHTAEPAIAFPLEAERRRIQVCLKQVCPLSRRRRPFIGLIRMHSVRSVCGF